MRYLSHFGYGWGDKDVRRSGRANPGLVAMTVGALNSHLKGKVLNKNIGLTHFCAARAAPQVRAFAAFVAFVIRGLAISKTVWIDR